MKMTKELIKKELKPCPFCGGKVVLTYYYSSQKGSTGSCQQTDKDYRVKCYHCRLEASFGEGIVDGAHWNADETIAAWNSGLNHRSRTLQVIDR